MKTVKNFLKIQMGGFTLDSTWRKNFMEFCDRGLNGWVK